MQIIFSLVFLGNSFLGIYCKGYFWNGMNNLLIIREEDGDGLDWGTVGEIVVLLEDLICTPLFRKISRINKHIGKTLHTYLKQLYFHRPLNASQKIFLSQISNFHHYKAAIEPPNIARMHKFIDYIYASSYFRDCQKSKLELS